MSRELFEEEIGIKITDENSDSGISILQGSGVPTGTGKQDEAEIGSVYFRRGTTEMYRKKTDTASAGDWELQGNASIGTFRPEKVVCVTGDTGVTPGSPRNLSTTPFSDDDGATLAAGDFAVGEFAIIDDVLLEVTNVSAPNVTFSTPGSAPALSEDDTFVTRYYLPDVGNDQEVQALVQYNGSTIVKVSDLNWNFADGIGMAAGYSAGSGDPSSADTVQSAIEKVDGNNDAQDTLLGTSQGDTDLGTFSGTTIADNETVKGALQDLELAHEETDQNVDDLITLSGVAENATDLGTFPGSVISDNTTIKNALTELEAKDEAQDLVISEIDQNVDDLITLSGVAENSTNLGAFTGFGNILLTATETIKSALQKVTDFLGGLRTVETTGITSQTAVDSVPVATVGACKWFVYAFEEATPTKVRAMEVFALNDGTSSKETVNTKIKMNGGFNFQIDTDVSGGNMRLLATSSTAGVTVRVRRVEVVAP